MARLGHRIMALTAAILFFITSVGFSLLVIWQIREQKKQDDINAGLQQALQETDKQKQTPGQEDKLEGTKLTGFTPVDKIGELQKVDLVVGNGDEVKPGDTVTVHYTGALAKDGTIFESSLDRGQTASFGLGEVIKGWTDGIPGMKVGGKRRLLIPSALAYGESGSGSSIPPNSDLVFDVELIKIGE